MATWLKIVLGLGISGILVVLLCVFYVIGVNNDCVQQEAIVKAQYSQNQNNYDSMWKKFRESVQIRTMYVDDLKKVYDSAIQGRYGAEGSKAVFQMLTESNPNLDAGVYKDLQVMIESGRNTFESNQKMLLDKKRVYEVTLQSFPNSIIARVLGFPKIDLSKFDIVTSDTTQKAFDTKKADEIKLR